ncbi:MAG: DUF2169 domain-containing protein [Polyangiaceae bacterium]|nr:DUF2169 domain-containing protein [Polyangiaceae bacterium]
MKVCKPLKVPILTRIVEFRKKAQLHVGAILGFPLARPRALVDELAFWDAVAPQLGASLLDESISKARGELLCAGRWFAPGGKPLGASFVRVTVGAIDKRVAVIGDRHWRRGVPTEPRPMTELPLDWAHAFGGTKHAKNPYGMGIETVERDGELVRPLPNVERFGALISSAGEKPEPEGLLPMDMSFAERRARAGTFGSDYVDKYAPGLPPDHQPTVFNAAREDQWLDGMWRGDERIVVENMSPTAARIESALPGLLARAFATQKTADGERFVELGLRCDTVWLFPAAGLGAVIFHGALAVADDDAADLAHLVVACEEPGAPRPIDHYRQALLRRLDKDTGALGDLSDSDLMPARESGVTANMDLGPIGQWVKSEMIGMANGHRGAVRRREQRRAEVVAEGLDPAVMGLDEPLPPPEPPPPTDDLDALAEYIVAVETRIAGEQAKVAGRDDDLKEIRRSMRAEMGLDPEAVDEPPGGPQLFDAEGELEEYRRLAAGARARGAPDLDLEERLQNPAFHAELLQLERMSRDTYTTSAHLLPAAPPMTEEASQLARVVIQAARDGGESLAERDFTGADLRAFDLSGLDFRRAFFEGADLRGANLSGACLAGAVLAKADLAGAALDGANLAGANLGRSNLEGASLAGADLSKVVMTAARLAGASLARATVVGADLLEVSWRGVDVAGACLDRCSFIKADLGDVKLGGASLVQATFIECHLDGADFTGANLHKATFVSCTGKGVRFTRARLDEAVLSHRNELPHGDFSDASADRCCLRTTALPYARFDRAQLGLADLSECDASHAVLDQARLDHALLIRTKLVGASLRGANLTEALLSKSLLAGADFTGAQLTRADFTRARGDDKTRFTEAVVKFTRFDKDGSAPRGPA